VVDLYNPVVRKEFARGSEATMKKTGYGGKALHKGS
jgi:hypothetical protein